MLNPLENNKIKILIVHNKYRNFGGEDANLEEEIKLLSKFYDVSVLKFDNSDSFNLFTIFSFLLNSNLKSNKLLKDKIESFSPDYAYVHNTWFTANLGIFKILKELNIKTYIKLHNFRLFCTNNYSKTNHLNSSTFCEMCGFDSKRSYIFNKYFIDSFLKSFLVVKYGKKYFKILQDNFFKLITLTNHQKKYFENISFVNKNINVLHNPIKFLNFDNLNYNPNSNFVVYVGRLTDEKGIDDLLSTWEKYNSSSLILLVIGTGNIEKKLKKKYKSYKVKFLGNLTLDKSLEYIRSSRAVITATKMYEGQPRVLSEASSLGVPSIFPNFGGMPEFFPMKYKLTYKQYDYDSLLDKLYLLEDKKLLRKLSKEVYSYSKNKFSNEAVLEIYRKLFV